MSPRTITLALAVAAAIATPAASQESPVYVGDYNPNVVRTGHDSQAGRGMDYTSTQSIAPPDQNSDPTLAGYSANVTRSDVFSGK